MKKNPKRIIKRIAGRLFSIAVDDYLASDLFLGFRHDHDLDDAWKEFLELSQDRPDLYGDDVMKNTVIGFLCHICHSRPGEFLALFSQFLAEFMQVADRRLPLDDLERDLRHLGCAEDDLEKEFLSLRAMEENRMKRGLVAGS
jgi:hypothetical protein